LLLSSGANPFVEFKGELSSAGTCLSLAESLGKKEFVDLINSSGNFNTPNLKETRRASEKKRRIKHTRLRTDYSTKAEFRRSKSESSLLASLGKLHSEKGRLMSQPNPKKRLEVPPDLPSPPPPKV